MENPILPTPMWGKKFENAEEIYKGDGITTCKWCGDTGYMHTFSIAGFFYNDAPCICKIGQKILHENLHKINFV